MKNVILINSFPNSDRKKLTLKTQIQELKKLSIPIILCSGCAVDDEIENLVDYIILNKEKIEKSALYQKKCFLKNRPNTTCVYIDLSSLNVNRFIFNSNVDPTIAKNTKLLFNLAKKLGFSNALYTEDDVLTNNIDYYKENLNILNVSDKKLCVIGDSFFKMPDGSFVPGLYYHTNHFFVNIDFFESFFCYPTSEEEFESEKVLSKISPWMAYEDCFAHSLINLKDKIHFIPAQYFYKISEKQLFFTRWDDLNFLAKEMCCLVKKIDNSVKASFYNCSSVLKINLKIYINDQIFSSWENVSRFMWLETLRTINIGDNIKFELKDQYNNIVTKEVKYCSEDDILSIDEKVLS